MISLLLMSTLSGLSPSQTVLMAYHMACNLGELRLDPSEATVSDGSNSSTPYSLWTWGKPQTLTYVTLNYPRYTSILIATYQPKYPQQMRRVCQVKSNAITRQDAQRGFLAAVQKPNVTHDMNPARGRTPFEIDRPKEGFKKRLMFYDAGWVVLETGLYKEPH